MDQQQLRATLQAFADQGQVAGVATATLRSGEVSFACAGWRDAEAGLPVEPATLFRIASVSKPITSVSALMLVEDGKIALSDSITKIAPEFAEMRVLRSAEGPLDETEPASREITFEDLLTHRAGLTYGDFHRGPINAAYREALGGDIDSDVPPEEWIARLANLPLIGQPGARMTYGRATDLLGLLIARIEGESLGSVLERRIFKPLGMLDTHFLVPTDKRIRRSAAYGFDSAGKRLKRSTWSGVVVEERPAEMRYESGGQGLWSTAQDFLKFARLFVNKGEVDGVRLLQPETLAMMMTNRLTDTQRTESSWMGRKPFATGRGFGLGVAVVLEQDPKDLMRPGHPGSVGWPGAYGGWWQADPVDGSVQVFLAHNMVDLEQMAQGIGFGVWMALGAYQKLAAS